MHAAPSSLADRLPTTPHPDTSNFIRPATHLLQPEQPLSRSSTPSPVPAEGESAPPPSYSPSNDAPPPPFSASNASSAPSHDRHPSSSTSLTALPLPLPLPKYTPSPTTEPHTLPRTLFFWGFLFPLLWVVGAIILYVPLRVVEEDWEESFEAGGSGRGDLESAGDVGGEEVKKRERELLDEKVVILRKAEIRWGKRCAIALGLFLVVVGTAVALALYLTRR